MSTPTYLFSLVLAVGGTMGYVKAKSKVSLVMGLGFSALFGYCGYLIDSGNTTTGHKFALVLSVILGLAMGRRYLATNKMMPSGVVLILSVVSAFYHFLNSN